MVLCFLHQMLLCMHCATFPVMPEDEVMINAISDHFSFFPTALKVPCHFAPGNPVSVCIMGAPDLKGKEGRLSDRLLRLQPNTHP